MLVDNYPERAFNRFALGSDAFGNGSSTFLRRSCERALSCCRDTSLNQSV